MVLSTERAGSSGAASRIDAVVALVTGLATIIAGLNVAFGSPASAHVYIPGQGGKCSAASRRMKPADLSAAPSEVADLVARLSGEGFSVEVTAFGGPQNQVIVLQKQGCDVRVVADRGQWFAEMQLDGMSDWFDADMWRACMDSEDVAIEPAPVALQVQFLLENWRRAVLMDPVRIEPCLQRSRSFRAYTRLGLKPPSM